MGNREEAKRADILHRPDEAEIDAACLDMADDIIGGAAFDMHADIGIFPANAREKRRQHADRCRINRADRNLPGRLAGD